MEEAIIRARPEVTSVSSVIGSEPAVISFGAGRLAQQGTSPSPGGPIPPQGHHLGDRGQICAPSSANPRASRPSTCSISAPRPFRASAPRWT